MGATYFGADSLAHVGDVGDTDVHAEQIKERETNHGDHRPERQLVCIGVGYVFFSHDWLAGYVGGWGEIEENEINENWNIDLSDY